MSEQAASLFQLASQASSASATPALGRGVIAVVGTRTDAGATTVATGLAQSLCGVGLAAVMVDAVPGRPDATRRLGLQPDNAVAAFLVGEAEICEAVTPLTSGIAVVVGGTDQLDLEYNTQAVKSRLRDSMRWLSCHFDWTVVDAGCLGSPVASLVCQHATHVIAVVDEQTNAIDGYAQLKTLLPQTVPPKTLDRRDTSTYSQATNSRAIVLLFNRTIVTDDATAKYGSIQRTARKHLGIDFPLAGYVYENENPSPLLDQLALSLNGEDSVAIAGKKDLTIQLATSDGR